MSRLNGKRIAIIATNGFEESELLVPMRALKEEGAQVEVLAPKGSQIRGWKDDKWTDSIPVDRLLEDANEANYDGCLVPGGTLNADRIRTDPHAVQLIGDFFEVGKPVAAICHGPQLLIEADVIAGRELTSYHSIRTDLENAGGIWMDEPVVVDHGLVTSRSPEDLPAFVAKMIEEFQEGIHEGSSTSGLHR